MLSGAGTMPSGSFYKDIKEHLSVENRSTEKVFIGKKVQITACKVKGRYVSVDYVILL